MSMEATGTRFNNEGLTKIFDALKEPGISLTTVNENQFLFHSDNDRDLEVFQAHLNDSDYIQTRILPAVSREMLQRGHRPAPKAKTSNPIWKLSGQDFMAKMFDADYLESLHLAPTQFSYNDVSRMASCKLTAKHPGASHINLGRVQTLQYALTNIDRVVSALDGSETAINSGDEKSPLNDSAKTILSYKYDCIDLNVTFNYGYLQAEYKKARAADEATELLVSSTTQRDHTLSTDSVLEMLRELAPSGVVGIKQEDGKVLPVILGKEEEVTEPPVETSEKHGAAAEEAAPAPRQKQEFHSWLDASGSMGNVMEPFKQQISSLMDKVAVKMCKSSQDFSLVPYSFSDSCRVVCFKGERFEYSTLDAPKRTNFTSDTAYDNAINVYATALVQNAKEFVSTFAVTGGTPLYAAMDHAFQNITESYTKDDKTNCCLIFLTDGEDGASVQTTSTMDTVVKSAEAARKGHPDLRIFLIGFGDGSDASARYMKDIASNTGAIYIRMQDPTDMSALDQYIESITVPQAIIQTDEGGMQQIADDGSMVVAGAASIDKQWTFRDTPYTWGWDAAADADMPALAPFDDHVNVMGDD